MTSDGKVFGKFRIERTDGKHAPGKKHHGCDYFVLDITHDPFAAAALKAYAEACKITHPLLSLSIWHKWGDQLQSVP